MDNGNYEEAAGGNPESPGSSRVTLGPTAGPVNQRS